MPDTGSPHALPYPAQTDPPNGPAQIQALAERIDVLLDDLDATRQAAGLVHFGRTPTLNTDSKGNLTFDHGASFTPTVMVVTPVKAGEFGLAVTMDGDTPMNSLHCFVNVWNVDTGAPYVGAVILCFIVRRALP